MEQWWTWDEKEKVLRDNKGLIREKRGKKRIKVDKGKERRGDGKVSKRGDEERRELESGVLKRSKLGK